MPCCNLPTGTCGRAHLEPPSAVSKAWVASQRAWVDLAVNQPVELSGTDGEGAAWTSSVHVLGVIHNSAANARSVHEVAGAVNPDAVGYEQDSSDDAWHSRITQAAQSAPMMELVDQLMEEPLDSYEQAHGRLRERSVWVEELSSAGLGISESDSLLHHLLGRPAYSEAISAAFIAHKLGAGFALIDCPDGRSMHAEFQTDPKGREFLLAALSLVRLTNEALGRSLAASFQLWVESDAGSQLLQLAVRTALKEALTPEATPFTLKAGPKKMQEASAQRERGMSRTIVDLCRGKLAGKQRKRVLVVVGRDHVEPLIKLLRAV
ncbi:hypothetical protein FOA52_003363 [Chlamydomonas sp. UWO 241]|nr:hypothetical protein FOA52_003363 [Chlamydomonas sp. UWO 241]